MLERIKSIVLKELENEKEYQNWNLLKCMEYVNKHPKLVEEVSENVKDGAISNVDLAKIKDHALGSILRLILEKADVTLKGRVVPDLSSTRLFKKEIQKIPVLTKQEEQTLFLQLEEVKKQIDEIDYFLPTIKNKKEVSEAKERLLVLNQEQQKIIGIIIQHNLRLVASIASNYKHIDFLTDISHGVAGLYEAIAHFDVHRGNKFSTYATWWIRSLIRRKGIEYQNQGHYSEECYDHYVEYCKIADFSNTPLTDEEVMKRLSISEEVWDKVKDMAKFQNMVSLNQSISLERDVTEEEHELMEMIEDEKTLSFDELLIEQEEQEEKNRLLQEALSMLNDSEKYILERMFEFYDQEKITYEQLGKELGVTRQRVNKIKQKALIKLKGIIEVYTPELKQYVK